MTAGLHDVSAFVVAALSEPLWMITLAFTLVLMRVVAVAEKRDRARAERVAR